MSKLMAKSLQGFNIIAVQGRQYRVAAASFEYKGDRPLAPKPEKRHPESQVEDDNELHYWVEHPVSRSMHGYIIGKGGSTLKRLKHETGTRIDVPKGEDIVKIKGTDENIERAKLAIDALVQESIEKARPTHFLSLPISSPLVTRRLEEFYKVLESPSFVADGITAESIAPIPSLHITLGVMKLMGQSEVEAAVRFLKESSAELISQVVGERGISVRLKTLDIMQSDASKARVLYIHVEDESENKVLDTLCAGLQEQMQEAGLMVKEKRPFKMHMTLVKKSGAKPKRSTADVEQNVEDETNNDAHHLDSDNVFFDARSILKEFRILDLGIVTLDSVHIMKMGMNKQGKYKSEGAVIIESDK
ncbi:hypothetical protein Unana1_00335 [Umbelopsis nana]